MFCTYIKTVIHSTSCRSGISALWWLLTDISSEPVEADVDVLSNR